MSKLTETVHLLLAGHKGLLAMDESNATCDKRFANEHIAKDVDTRRAYRELIVTTPGLSEYVSGLIPYDETIRQKAKEGKSFVSILTDAGIVSGVKVDTGAKALAGHKGETITEGLDGLRDRLHEYVGLGARFAKWRAVFALGEGLPSRACLDANAHALARYAALCQEAGIVPVVGPEVLMSGDHGLQRCAEATETVLRSVFDELARQNVVLEAMILKPNMILPGTNSDERPSPGSRRCDAAGAASCGPGGGSRHSLSMWRTERRARQRAPECDEPAERVAGGPLGADVLVRPRDSATSAAYLGRQGHQSPCRPTRPAPPRRLQPGRESALYWPRLAARLQAARWSRARWAAGRLVSLPAQICSAGC